MKKTLRKPENWQDFETLCKKLWGEIFCIPNNIKKNGRLGQMQNGVDVYGIPKGENSYWGIQAKGKDDYSDARLKNSEIIIEIEKAKKFQPTISVYIIASTANKDVEIEEFVRLKDIENRASGSFEILLYCWEDIVDLIEENPNTYNWYLNDINHRSKFDFSLWFNDFEEKLTLTPIFERNITRYISTDKPEMEILRQNLANTSLVKSYDLNLFQLYRSNEVNKSWCKFKIIMDNTGSAVLEDWKLILKFTKGVERLDSGTIFFKRISLTNHIDDESKTITYRPIGDRPLIQKDNRSFEISLLPSTDCEKIVVEWELLARDYNKTDVFEIGIVPEFIESISYEEISVEDELPEEKISITYNVVAKTN
ncbi:hypothetical protein [Pedobacter sp.]